MHPTEERDLVRAPPSLVFELIDVPFGPGGIAVSGVDEGVVAHRMIGAETLETVRLLATFGALIGNTDRHFGNLLSVKPREP